MVVTGYNFLTQLCKALNITGPVCKIVIEAECDSAVNVYVKRYMDESEGDAVCGIVKAVQDVTVADDCTVVVKQDTAMRVDPDWEKRI